MKLWKYILGAIAFIGGIIALSSTSKKGSKKEFNNKVEENKTKTKKIQEASKKVEAEKIETKKQVSKAKKKTSTTKSKVKNTASAKNTVKNVLFCMMSVYNKLINGIINPQWVLPEGF